MVHRLITFALRASPNPAKDVQAIPPHRHHRFGHRLLRSRIIRCRFRGLTHGEHDEHYRGTAHGHRRPRHQRHDLRDDVRRHDQERAGEGARRGNHRDRLPQGALEQAQLYRAEVYAQVLEGGALPIEERFTGLTRGQPVRLAHQLQLRENGGVLETLVGGTGARTKCTI